MSKDKISDYSSTPANNTDIGGINIAEGMLPSDVNNAIREQMAQLKNFQSGASSESVTFVTVRIVTSINDTNGNEVFGITATGSAVNELTIANAATTVSPEISATGSDTNIGIRLIPKGTGGVVFPAGAVGTPAITTTGDTNTGIFFPAADTIAFAEGGAEAMRIDSSGNVGIGTSSPATKLNVKGSAATLFESESTGAGSFLGIKNSGGYAYVGSISNALVFLTSANGDERMRIDSSGNVGIGTTSPKLNTNVGTFLSVVGTNASGWLDLGTTSSADGFGGTVAFNNTNIVGSDKRIAYISAERAGANNTANLTFGTNNAGTLAERARITSGGDLLIGTTSLISGGVDGLHISSATDTGISFAQSGTAKAYFYLGGGGSGTNWRWQTVSGITADVVSGGSGGVTLANGGTSWGSLSDERKKDIIEPIENAAEKVSSLRAVIGKYKTEEDGIRRSMLIAQDVQAVLPEAVVENSDGDLILQYTETIPLLVAAIQELKAITDTQAQTISALEARIAALENGE